MPSMVRLLAACFACLVPTQALFAQAAGERLAGEVVSMEDGRLILGTAAGQRLSVVLADNLRVTIRAPGDLSRLDPGLYVGATAVAQPDGTLLASLINVFPESMRGTAEGHRPMANLPGSTMTNATVRQVASTVTNASVTGASSGPDARRLVLTFAGGEKTVIVPPGAVVVFSEVGDRGALVPGANVIVYALRRPDGSLATERISVGKNGSTPPT